jgi:type IV pilus assembly protein PilA
MRRHTQKPVSLRAFTLLEIMIVVAVIAVLAAIAIPNFLRFQARTKQAEAKTNLRALFTAEKSYYAEKDAFVTNGATAGWGPEGANRYRYQLTNVCTTLWTRPNAPPANGYDCITEDTSRFNPAGLGPVAVTVTLVAGAPVASFSVPGVVGTCPDCGFMASAEGNLDNDTKLDDWVITSHDGTIPFASGACAAPETNITAGNPAAIVNDATCD